jgi:hypothetical protein
MGGSEMSEGLGVVIGMSIAYIASFTGLIFAWIHYRKRKAGKSVSGQGR